MCLKCFHRGKEFLPLSHAWPFIAHNQSSKFLCCREADVQLDKWCKPRLSVRGYVVVVR